MRGIFKKWCEILADSGRVSLHGVKPDQEMHEPRFSDAGVDSVRLELEQEILSCRS